MLIAVQDGLEDIKNYLEKLEQYTIKNINNCNGEEDVIIYKKMDTEKEFRAYQFEYLNNMLENKNEVSEGILMINANHKSLLEIEELLKNRFKIYSDNE